MENLIKALIFDFDGVIVDTEVADFDAWQEVFRRRDAVLKKEDWVQIIGSNASRFDVIACLQRQLHYTVNENEIRQEKREIYRRQLAGLKPMHGVENMLRQAKEAHLKLAIASSSPSSWVVPLLKDTALFDFFNVICTADDVSNVKPDPELFLLAIEKLNCPAENAIIIEDSFHGVTAAHSAGIKVIAVPNVMTRELDFSKADAVIHSLQAYDLPGLVARVGGKI